MPSIPRRSSRLWLVVAAALLPALPAPAAARPAPRRIVSLDLCADQYVIALAEPGRIAALSRYARDPAMSYHAAAARRLPTTAGSMEAVLLLRPDLVIGAPARSRPLLATRGVAMLALPPNDGQAGIEATIRLVAAALGHPARGSALIAAMRARLAAVGPPPGRGRVAAYYQRQGFLTGTGTLVDEMLGRVGLVNLARRLGLPALSRLSVERMAIARPDFLVLESAPARAGDRGTEMLHHPLLGRVFPADRRLFVPEAMTVCGGPFYGEAVALLAARVRAADRTHR